MDATPRYASVVFDCDSTLADLEGIDAVCDALGPDEAARAAALTAAAMNGEVALADVYERRLAIVQPCADDLQRVGRRYVERMVPGAGDVVRTLLDRGVDVAIVSGGLAPAVRVLARELGLAEDAVHAVDVRFDDAGRYVDFDRSSPLWRNQGKVEVLAALRARRSPLLFVGDGVTDLEARSVVDLFVGYGGVVVREAVRRGADVYFADRDLGFVLDLVFGEGATLPRRGPGPRAR